MFGRTNNGNGSGNGRSGDGPLEGEIFGPGVPLPGFDRDPDPAQERRVREKFFRTLRKATKYIPFREDLVAAYYCALDPLTPGRVRGTLIAALAYFVLPLDAVPDFIIGVGFGDDITILTGAIALVRAHIKDRHREAARTVLAEDDAGRS